MAIYDFSTKPSDEFEPELPASPRKNSLFSAIAARLFFLLLLVANLVWMGYTLIRSLVCLCTLLCTGGRSIKTRHQQSKCWIALRRSIVCAVALVVALFSPSFGVMLACTYFLMYDKAGINEVVPASLQSEFKELMPKG